MIIRAPVFSVGPPSFLSTEGPADLRHFDDFPFKKLPAAEDGTPATAKVLVALVWRGYTRC